MVLDTSQNKLFSEQILEKYFLSKFWYTSKQLVKKLANFGFRQVIDKRSPSALGLYRPLGSEKRLNNLSFSHIRVLKRYQIWLVLCGVKVVHIPEWFLSVFTNKTGFKELAGAKIHRGIQTHWGAGRNITFTGAIIHQMDWRLFKYLMKCDSCLEKFSQLE
jgi:hypothetical protein